MSNTHTYPKKEDLEIVVGDEKQEDFYPRVKIKRWDNEVNFSVGVVSAHAGTDSNVSDKVEWDDGHGTKARFYEKEGDEFEFEIELASKPVSNVIEMSIETKGLRFLYQPELTEEESAINPKTGRPRHTRPDNVVGSYAVYHESMKGNYIGGKNYRAGKFCHIYRPFVTDTNGKQEWCDMNITGAVMKIIIPDGLVYPVIVDPTFGTNPSIPGESWGAVYADEMHGTLYTSPSDMDTAQSTSSYLKAHLYDFYAKGLIVIHSNLNIITNGIGSPSTQITSTTGIWALSDFATDPSPTASTEYVLMHICDEDYWLAYDAGDTDQSHHDTSNSYTSPANPTSAVHSNYEVSVYCTYTSPTRFGEELCFNTTNSEYIDVAMLDSTHFVVAYKDTGGDGYGCARVGSISGTTITYGAENVFNSADTNHISVAALDSTHFVVAYRDEGGANCGCARIGLVSGTTISSYGTENTFNASSTYYISVDKLDSTHFVVVYQDSVTYYGRARIGLVSGTTISSYGTENTFNAARSEHCAVSALDSTHFVVSYFDYPGTYHSCARVGLVSGTTISSFGAENEFTTDASVPDVAALDATHFVVAWGTSYGRAKIGLVSGTTISSYGTQSQFNTGSTYVSVDKLDSTHFALVYNDNGGDGYGYARKGTVSGTTISSYSSEETFNAADSDYISVASIDSGVFVVVYKDTGGQDYGCARIWEVFIRELTATIATTTATNAIILGFIRELSATIATTTSLSDIELITEVVRELVTTIAVATSTSIPSMDVVRELSAAIATSTSTAAGLNILREYVTTIASTTSTSTPSINIIREILSTIASTTSTSDADLIVLREILTTIAATTSTNVVSLPIDRALDTTIGSTTLTSAPIINILRELNTTIATATLLSEIELFTAYLIEFSATIATSTSTSAVDMNVVREILATIAANTSAANISLQINRALDTTIDSTTLTSTPAINILRELTSTIAITTIVSDIELIIANLIEFVTEIATTTSTSAAQMNVVRDLSASIDTTTSMSTPTLAALIELVTVIATTTSTSSSTLNVIRSFTSAITTTTSTSDINIVLIRALSAQIATGTDVGTATMMVLRELSSTVSTETLVSSIELLMFNLGILNTKIESMTIQRTIN